MKILHLLSQRPSLTGSGITLDALVRQAHASQWEQEVCLGTPAEDLHPKVGGLAQNRIHSLVFGTSQLDFSLPGMSDVMPYESSRFSSLSSKQIQTYRNEWKTLLCSVMASFRPDIVHSHHLWILSSIVKDVCSYIPVVTHCHATGFRQMELCPHLVEDVKLGLRRNDHFVVLHQGQAGQLAQTLSIKMDRITVVGAGYNESLFCLPTHIKKNPSHILYAGKFSNAKGLPWLLDACEHLAQKRKDIHLHIAGSGRGAEAEQLFEKMSSLSMRGLVTLHGQLDQRALAELMQRCSVFVLPSFFEGLPLVLVEALACGCRLVCTSLPVVTDELVPHLPGAIETVPLPRLLGPDRPHPEDIPLFVENLHNILDNTLKYGTLDTGSFQKKLSYFSWKSVFRRNDELWTQLIRLKNKR